MGNKNSANKQQHFSCSDEIDWTAQKPLHQDLVQKSQERIDEYFGKVSIIITSNNILNHNHSLSAIQNIQQREQNMQLKEQNMQLKEQNKDNQIDQENIKRSIIIQRIFASQEELQEAVNQVKIFQKICHQNIVEIEQIQSNVIANQKEGKMYIGRVYCNYYPKNLNYILTQRRNVIHNSISSLSSQKTLPSKHASSASKDKISKTTHQPKKQGQCLTSRKDKVNMITAFSEKEVWYMVDSLIDGLKLFQDQDIIHGDLRPQTIYLTEIGHIKLSIIQCFAKDHSHTNFHIAAQHVLQGKSLQQIIVENNLLLSVEQLVQLNRLNAACYCSSSLQANLNKDITNLNKEILKKQEFNPYKSQVFSLGILVLQIIFCGSIECCQPLITTPSSSSLMQNQSRKNQSSQPNMTARKDQPTQTQLSSKKNYLYIVNEKTKEMTVNFDLLSQLLIIVKTTFSLSLYKLLNVCLDVNQTNRPDCLELYNELRNLDLQTEISLTLDESVIIKQPLQVEYQHGIPIHYRTQSNHYHQNQGQYPQPLLNDKEIKTLFANDLLENQSNKQQQQQLWQQNVDLTKQCYQSWKNENKDNENKELFVKDKECFAKKSQSQHIKNISVDFMQTNFQTSSSSSNNYPLSQIGSNLFINQEMFNQKELQRKIEKNQLNSQLKTQISDDEQTKREKKNNNYVCNDSNKKMQSVPTMIFSISENNKNSSKHQEKSKIPNQINLNEYYSEPMKSVSSNRNNSQQNKDILNNNNKDIMRKSEKKSDSIGLQSINSIKQDVTKIKQEVSTSNTVDKMQQSSQIMQTNYQFYNPLQNYQNKYEAMINPNQRASSMHLISNNEGYQQLINNQPDNIQYEQNLQNKNCSQAISNTPSTLNQKQYLSNNNIFNYQPILQHQQPASQTSYLRLSYSPQKDNFQQFKYNVSQQSNEKNHLQQNVNNTLQSNEHNSQQNNKMNSLQSIDKKKSDLNENNLNQNSCYNTYTFNSPQKGEQSPSNKPSYLSTQFNSNIYLNDHPLLQTAKFVSEQSRHQQSGLGIEKVASNQDSSQREENELKHIYGSPKKVIISQTNISSSSPNQIQSGYYRSQSTDSNLYLKQFSSSPLKDYFNQDRLPSTRNKSSALLILTPTNRLSLNTHSITNGTFNAEKSFLNSLFQNDIATIKQEGFNNLQYVNSNSQQNVNNKNNKNVQNNECIRNKEMKENVNITQQKQTNVINNDKNNSDNVNINNDLRHSQMEQIEIKEWNDIEESYLSDFLQQSTSEQVEANYVICSDFKNNQQVSSAKENQNKLGQLQLGEQRNKSSIQNEKQVLNVFTQLQPSNIEQRQNKQNKQNINEGDTQKSQMLIKTSTHRKNLSMGSPSENVQPRNGCYNITTAHQSAKGKNEFDYKMRYPSQYTLSDTLNNNSIQNTSILLLKQRRQIGSTNQNQNEYNNNNNNNNIMKTSSNPVKILNTQQNMTMRDISNKDITNQTLNSTKISSTRNQINPTEISFYSPTLDVIKKMPVQQISHTSVNQLQQKVNSMNVHNLQSQQKLNFLLTTSNITPHYTSSSLFNAPLTNKNYKDINHLQKAPYSINLKPSQKELQFLDKSQSTKSNNNYSQQQKTILQNQPSKFIQQSFLTKNSIL